MTKYKNIIIIGAVIIVVFIATFLLSGLGPTYIKKISFEEYKEKSSSSQSTAFFIGKEGPAYDYIKALTKAYKVDIFHVEESDLTSEQKEELKDNTDKLFVMNNGEVIYTHHKEDKNYKVVKTLMNEDIIEDNYIEVSFDDYLNIIKEEGYQFIFIGSASCGYCTNFKPEIKLTLSEYNANIYYLDIAKLSQDQMQALYASDPYYTENEWGTPLNLLFKDGKRINVLNGYVPSADLTKFLKDNKVIK